MKATELRIRNYVSYDNRIFQIDSISDLYPTLNTIEFGIGVVDWNNIQPIRLTEDWLLMLGFEEGNKGYYAKGDVVISVEGEVYFGETETWIASIYYVHSLQNLYFALIGQEI
jgi:hypothetical protein